MRSSPASGGVQFRKLGASGLEASPVGLGCNPFGNEVDAPTAQAIVDRAIELGVNYFDTAPSYYDGRSEEYLGRALKGHRSRVIVATKFAPPATRDHILASCEASLRRLQTDVIDLYQAHRPDRQTPIDETLEVLNTLAQLCPVPRSCSHRVFPV